MNYYEGCPACGVVSLDLAYSLYLVYSILELLASLSKHSPGLISLFSHPSLSQFLSYFHLWRVVGRWEWAGDWCCEVVELWECWGGDWCFEHELRVICVCVCVCVCGLRLGGGGGGVW